MAMDPYLSKKTEAEKAAALNHKVRGMTLHLTRLGVQGRYSEVSQTLAHMDADTRAQIAASAIAILGATLQGTGTQTQALATLDRHIEYMEYAEGLSRDE